MPALYTHYLFGQECKDCIDRPDLNLTTSDELDAFFLGSQGPDPFFFHIRGRNTKASHAYGHQSHNTNIAHAFHVMREALELFTSVDKPVAQAYLLGFLTHYTLDSHTHPFVYAQQYALIDASQALHNADSYVHAVIESDIDSSLLKIKKDVDIYEFNPTQCLKGNHNTLMTIGRLHAYTAEQVYGIKLAKTAFESAVKDMRLIYKMISSPKRRRARGISRLERITSSHSMLNALTHRPASKITYAALNLEHNRWVHPFEPVLIKRFESFIDLYEKALSAYGKNIEVLLEQKDPTDITRHINYNGALLEDDERAIKPGLRSTQGC